MGNVISYRQSQEFYGGEGGGWDGVGRSGGSVQTQSLPKKTAVD